MTARRLLATGEGGAPATPGGPLPPDPTLVTPRAITAPLAINQSVGGIPAGGKTFEYTLRVVEDAASIRLLFGGMSQGFITDPATLKASVRPEGGAWTVVQFGGDATGLLPRDGYLLSDPASVPLGAGTDIKLRVFTPEQAINFGGTFGPVTTGEHLTEDVLPSPDEYVSAGPLPVAIIGASRASVICPAVYGDSISANASWFSGALLPHDLPGVNFGRNVMTFNGRWLSVEALAPVTHMLVQFGANDIGSGPSVASLWASAVGCYEYIDGLKPGLPIWQTTTTPSVSSTNDCATLDGQTVSGVSGPARANWIEFLRDGAPCHPSTRAALTVGATGTVIRAGHDDHPLRDIVDIAAAVEHGGIEAPSGKWRVDLGPLGGDGVHPSGLGQAVMTPPVEAWAASLT